jgi:ankyrin repeat protein
VKYLLEHGVRVTKSDEDGNTALLCAAMEGNLEVVQYLLSSEGGASITETSDDGKTALLMAGACHKPSTVQWLLEYGGAQITDTNNKGESVWTGNQEICGVGALLRIGRGLEGNMEALEAMLRVMVLHGAPPESVAEVLAPQLQQIVQDGARLRARLPAYLTQRRALIDAHCPLLPPLRDLVHGYEEPTTTDELWATELGAPL